jgi:hypothetical protein
VLQVHALAFLLALEEQGKPAAAAFVSASTAQAV